VSAAGVYPVHLERTDCWCEPTVCVVCPECRGAPASAPVCWRCAGVGLVLAPPEITTNRIIIHRDIPARECTWL
jgi:hypothetical protein